jgi:hypothetical protein
MEAEERKIISRRKFIPYKTGVTQKWGGGLGCIQLTHPTNRFFMQMAQVAVCSQTNSKHINTVWAERTIVKILNFLLHPVTSRL